MFRAAEQSRRCAFRSVAWAAGLLATAGAGAATHPSYRGLLYPNAPVAAVPLPGGAFANTFTGNLVILRGILAVPGRGVPVELFLVFNADRRRVTSPFGKGWTFSYNLRYVDDAAGNVRIVWGDGRVDLFSTSGGGFASPAGVFSTLSRPAPGVLELRSTHGMVFHFADAASRKLTSIVDPNGNTLALDHDSQGRLTSLTDASGRQWLLEYDAAGMLVTIRDPNRGNRSWTLVHDGAGHLTAITDPLGETELFAYGADDLPASITDRRGHKTVFTFGGGAGAPVATAAKQGSTVALAFDAGQLATTITDPAGAPWVHGYSTDGQLVGTADPLAGTASYVWSVNDLLLEYRDRRGHFAELTYDAKGNLTKLDAPLSGAATSSAVISYDPICNAPASVTDPRGNIWTFTMDAACNVARVDDPAAIGTHTTFAHDAMGQATSATDRSGRTTVFDWDGDGNLAGVTDPLGGETRFEHNGAGRVTKVTDPLDHEFSFEYDALDRLVAAADAYDKVEGYQYDEEGRLLRFTDREGNQTHWSYDELGRLVSTTNALGSSDLHTYDAAGRLVAYMDRLDNTWTRTFDPLGRVVETRDPVGRTRTTAYDANDNPTAMTDGKGQTTVLTYDEGDRLVRRDFADGSRTTFTYDAGDNLLTAIDRVSPAGAITSNLSFVYDAANRKTRSNDDLLGRNVRKTWDGDGRQLTQIDLVGNVATYAYDAAGRYSRIAGFGGAAAYSRDAAGRIVLDQRDSGVSATYTWDDNGRLASNTIRGPVSPPPALAPGGPVIESFAYTRDQNGDIVAALRETAEHVAFTRDQLRRAVTEAGTLGGAYTTTVEYDGNGNRRTDTFVKAGFNQVISLTFDDAGRARTFSNQINGAGPSATYTLDANGSRTLATYAAGGSTAYTYNVRDQLTGVADTPGSSSTFAYDGLDRLAARTSGVFTTRYLYGSPPAGATDAAGTPQVNLTRVPVAACGGPAFTCFASAGLPQLPRIEGFAEDLGPVEIDVPEGQLRLSNLHLRSAPIPSWLPDGAIIRVDVLGASHDVFPEGNSVFITSLTTNSNTGSVSRRRDSQFDLFHPRSNSGSLGVGEPYLWIGVQNHDDLGLAHFGDVAFEPLTGQTLNAGDLPPLGTGPVTGGYAPLSTIARSAGGPIPRFATGGDARNVFNISLCRTILLYPFITAEAGFDTGIAISNTSMDPFGTDPQAGSCAPDLCGGAAGTCLSQRGGYAGFQSYPTALCDYQFAHGYAFLSDFGARNLAMGYLALVVSDAAASGARAVGTGEEPLQ
jgi:YD repeat-containing protein